MNYIIELIKKYKYLIVAILIVLIAYASYLFINRKTDKNPEENSNSNSIETMSLEEQKKALDEEFQKLSPPTEEELEKQKQELGKGFENLTPPTEEELEKQKQELQELKNNL
ncbi:hypothetical protein KKA24_00425 [Patescibacteria group bacterium]|nr:hypothetical protein [Patescibacteria group bacterium]